MKKKLQFLILLLITSLAGYCQNVSLYEQFNGRYDFTFVGNTLNPVENNLAPVGVCDILTTSSAQLQLERTNNILKAYLYWAGCGPGDFDVLLNGTPVSAQRTFPLAAVNTDQQTRNYFSAFADVTAQVQATGNGSYTISDLDVTAWATSGLYCGIKTNFAGWVIIVVYQDENLPLNQLNLYDGLEYVPSPRNINISLPSLNVIDNIGAKIGFVAWEGDSDLAIRESFTINGDILTELPLNPDGNAFNGTNSVTQSDTLYNMDLDIYNIQDHISIGDETADIRLASGQDFVMINAIITKLNSQLPDATVTVENIGKQCGSRILDIDYTIHNVNSTDVLPADTNVGIYINTVLVATVQTTADLPIGGSESGTVSITVPAGVPRSFELLFWADNTRTVTETNEDNNTLTLNETLWLQNAPNAQDIHACQTILGSNRGIFNFSGYATSLMGAPDDVVTFYTSQADAQVPRNALSLSMAAAFLATSNPQEIYVRVQDGNGCTAFTSFTLITDACLFPDATVAATISQSCDSRVITVTYTVSNTNGFAPLPDGTPVGIYAGSQLLATVATTAVVSIGGSLTATASITIPAGISSPFNLNFIADDGNTVRELAESNNTFLLGAISLFTSPTVRQPENITVCETSNGSNIGIFNFSAYGQSLKNNPTDVVTFYTTQSAADTGGNNFISNPGSYTSTGANPQTIYVRLQDVNGCYDTATFLLIATDCLFPDATVTIDEISQQCDSRDISVVYTVHNFNSFDILPAGTPVAFYADTTLLGVRQTVGNIPVNGSLTAVVNLNIPAGIPLNFNLNFVADDNGTGTGVVVENNENNNSSLPFAVSLWISPVLRQPATIFACETFNGSGIGIFDFSGYAESLKNIATDSVTFHTTLANATDGSNDIATTNAYTAPPNTQLYARLEDVNGCYDVKPFTLLIKDCYFPDATVVIEEVYKQCNSRIIHVHYHVSNINGTDVLPAETPVSIYINGSFLDYTETIEDIAIGESESGYITLTIPVGIPLNFNLTFVADDSGDGSGIVTETDEANNSFTLPTTLVLSPVLLQPEDLLSCDKGLGSGSFDFSGYADSLKNYPYETVTFYRSQQTADQALNQIYNTTQYISETNPERIFVRLDNGTCHTTASFLLKTKKCAPVTYNYVTPNGDNINDSFFVEGLRNIFLNFKMTIYNRWGNLVWTGDHSKADWDGIADVQKVGNADTTVPTGTYYFVLELNDPDFPEPVVGWVYVTR